MYHSMLKPFELTRFVVKIDLENQFVGQLLGKVCWHWMEPPVPLGSRFSKDEKASHAQLRLRNEPKKTRAAPAARKKPAPADADKENGGANSHLLFDADNVIRPKSAGITRGALQSLSKNASTPAARPQTAAAKTKQNPRVAQPHVARPVGFTGDGADYGGGVADTLGVSGAKVVTGQRSKQGDDSRSNFSTRSGRSTFSQRTRGAAGGNGQQGRAQHASVAQRHEIATFTRARQRQEHMAAVKKTQQQQAGKDTMRCLLSGMAQLRMDIANLDSGVPGAAAAAKQAAPVGGGGGGSSGSSAAPAGGGGGAAGSVSSSAFPGMGSSRARDSRDDAVFGCGRI
jgi:hypothetical protein